MISLVAVCGLTPQVLTETVYALAQQGRTPDRVRVLTTRSGRDACMSLLFDGGRGAWFRLLDDLGLKRDRIDFSADAVWAVTGEGGVAIDDIATEEENEAFVRAALELAWQVSRDPEDTVFYSIAGGRKTMGAALAFAAQAYGRPQDRIYHVLVSPEFENCRDFFYPPANPVELELRDPKGQPYRKSTRYARVNLVALPFVPFRERLGADVLRRPEDPGTLLSSLVRERPGQLVVDLPGRKIVWKGREIDLPPAQLALYALFAEIRKQAACDDTCPGCDACQPTAAEVLARQERLSSLYRAIMPTRQPEEMSDTGIFSLTPDNMLSYLAKIQKRLESGFGHTEAARLAVQRRGTRPRTGYGLGLPRAGIRIIH